MHTIIDMRLFVVGALNLNVNSGAYKDCQCFSQPDPDTCPACKILTFLGGRRFGEIRLLKSIIEGIKLMEDAVKDPKGDEVPKFHINIPEGVEISAEERAKLERDTYGAFANYMHNNLGITKDYVTSVLNQMCSDERKKLEAQHTKVPEEVRAAIKALIGYTEAPEYSVTDWFKGAVRSIIIGEINTAIKDSRQAGKPVSSLCDFVKVVLEEEIKKVIMTKIKIDFAVSFVDPPDGQLRELHGTEDRFASERPA
jgi:hypothetical protein